MDEKKNRAARVLQAPDMPQRPPEIEALIAAVAADDRQWFENHPEASVRPRPAVAGEFWPIDMSHVGYVLVLQVRPGFRLRVGVATMPEGTEVN